MKCKVFCFLNTIENIYILFFIKYLTNFTVYLYSFIFKYNSYIYIRIIMVINMPVWSYLAIKNIYLIKYSIWSEVDWEMPGLG